VGAATLAGGSWGSGAGSGIVTGVGTVVAGGGGAGRLSVPSS
jgi:hypothetical protein